MLKCQKKWLELFLKKFLLCTFRNNVESETVLYLTNGRKKEAVAVATASFEFIQLLGMKSQSICQCVLF